MSKNYDPLEEDYCPPWCSSTPDDIAGFRVISLHYYSCDEDKLRDMPKKEADRYREELQKSGRTYDPDKVVDIYSHGSFEESCLSNFYGIHFELDGVELASMEGFLQSLKTPDIKEQRRICSLIGKEAKNAGLATPNFDGEHLYWQGKTINRFKEEYHTLLRRAYRARFEQDGEFRNALKNTKHKKLMHTLGNNNHKETILTTDEFIGFLRELQEEL